MLTRLLLVELTSLWFSEFKIEQYQFCPCIIGSELPSVTGCLLIAIALPSFQLLPKQVDVSNPTGQALTCHYIPFYFRNVQLVPMLGSVMELQFFNNPAGFRSRKFSTVFPDTDIPYAGQRFYEYKYTTDTVSDIFEIKLLGIPWANSQWFPIFQASGMTFHPYIRLGQQGHMTFHKYPECPPCRLWILHFLSMECTSRRFGEVKVHYNRKNSYMTMQEKTSY